MGDTWKTHARTSVFYTRRLSLLILFFQRAAQKACECKVNLVWAAKKACECKVNYTSPADGSSPVVLIDLWVIFEMVCKNTF